MPPKAERTMYFVYHGSSYRSGDQLRVEDIYKRVADARPGEAYEIHLESIGGVIPLPKELLLWVLSTEEFPVSYVMPGYDSYSELALNIKYLKERVRNGDGFSYPSPQQDYRQSIREIIESSDAGRIFGIEVEGLHWTLPVQRGVAIDVCNSKEFKITQVIVGVNNIQELRQIMRVSQSKTVAS
jgi:hypothetical protein